MSESHPLGRAPGFRAIAFFALLAIPACSSGGGGGSGSSATSFQMEDTNLGEGAVWPINQEMVFVFTEPLDFTTVSANTVQVRSALDVPATGVFHLRDAHTLVFQGTCPTREDLSDAGLSPGETYRLRIPGLNTSGNVLRSTSGVPLGVQQQRTFSTPISTQPSIVFRDVRVGPPEPIVRAQGSSDVNATYLELGGDPSQRVYFERDANDEVVLSDPGFRTPLNLYSDASSRVAILV